MSDLSCNLPVDYICARANARLHYLKRLKRAGLPTDRLAIWYSSVNVGAEGQRTMIILGSLESA